MFLGKSLILFVCLFSCCMSYVCCVKYTDTAVYVAFQSNCSDTGTEMSENWQMTKLVCRPRIANYSAKNWQRICLLKHCWLFCSKYARQWWPLPFAGHSKPPGPTGLSPATTMATAWANAHWPHPHRWLPSVIWSFRALYTFVVLSFQKHMKIW